MITYVIKDENNILWALFDRDEKTKDKLKGYNNIFKYFKNSGMKLEGFTLLTHEDGIKIKEVSLKSFLEENY